MKNKYIAGIPAVLFGALIAIAPMTFAQPCPVHGDHPMMACHWTAKASLGIGAMIAVLGLINFLVKAPTRIGLNISVAAAAVLEILVVTVLIGVCGMPTMHCRQVMLPTLVIVSVLTLLCALVAIWFDCRSEKIAK